MKPIECTCGRLFTRADVLDNRDTDTRGIMPMKYLMLRCGGCGKLVQRYVRVEDWRDDLLQEPPQDAANAKA